MVMHGSAQELLQSVSVSKSSCLHANPAGKAHGLKKTVLAKRAKERTNASKHAAKYEYVVFSGPGCDERRVALRFVRYRAV